MNIKPKTAVLMGGISKEREISLKSGKAVLSSLLKSGVNAFSFDPKHRSILELKEEKVDNVFIALHGKFGEDGMVQGILEFLKLPYTGSDLASSSLAMNKTQTKRIWNALGLKNPAFFELDKSKNIKNYFDLLSFPLIVKPVSEGSSLGVVRVEKFNQLESAIEEAYSFGEKILIEKLIKGRELTCGLLNLNSGNEITTLPIIEIIAPKGNYNFHNKYVGSDTKYICPALIPSDIETKIKEIALKAFSTLGCTDWGRVDFILDELDIPYLLEVNTVPGMTNNSLVPMAASKFGLSFDELVLCILSRASLNNKG